MLQRRIFSTFLMIACAITPALRAQEAPAGPLQAAVEQLLSKSTGIPDRDAYEQLIPPNTKLVSVERDGSTARVVFNFMIHRRVWRPQDVAQLQQAVLQALQAAEPAITNVEISARVSTEGSTTATLADFTTSTESIRQRAQAATNATPRPVLPVVQRPEYKGPVPDAGLQGRNFVLGPSHGDTWHKENRWQFQRARTYTTIEDLFPLSYINPFLAPMLEKAGANVWSVRERDYQTAEVVIDNDGADTLSTFRSEGPWAAGDIPGWQGGRPAVVAPNDTPFARGTTIAVTVPQDDVTTTTAVYTPYIPRTGRYAVYASWAMAPGNSPSVPIEIRHAGGSTTLRVNQQVAGGTWVPLGFYEFEQGADEARASVTIRANGATRNPSGTTTVTADAVRFGGGMSNAVPGGLVSGKPRTSDAALYWTQYAGLAPERVQRDFGVGHFGLDYNRDITARGEFVNWLNRPATPPTAPPEQRGLGVPIEAYLSFHTDAGYSASGLIGTLMLYNVVSDGSTTFPDGRTRWLNRDFATIMQDELVRTARALYTSTWRRRHMQWSAFGEARRPEVPALILELLSHHNFNDMQYGLDPRFKRDMSRALYKSMLRFVAASNGYEPVFTPLEPTHLTATATGANTAEVRWQPQADPLEPSATSDGYIVYASRDGRSFDNGTFVQAPPFRVADVQLGSSLYFRVTAVNRGGESFPSRLVGVRIVPGSPRILVVDGFDRVSGPLPLKATNTEGFVRAIDPGVGYHHDYGTVGDMYIHDPGEDWMNDLENPGHGGSQSADEDALRLGNTFDHIARHGDMLALAGFGFDSATADVYTRTDAPELHYDLVDWIAGLQKTTPPPIGIEVGAPDRMKPEFPVMDRAAAVHIADYLRAGGRLLISGAYVTTDLRDASPDDSGLDRFVSNALGIAQSQPAATRINHVRAAAAEGPFARVLPFRFGMDLEPRYNLTQTVYTVPSAEGFTRLSPRMEPVLAYGDTGTTAVAAGSPMGGDSRVVIMGFPLETVLPAPQRQQLIAATMEYLGFQPTWPKDPPRETRQ